jgi:hypothetical protein
MATSVVPELLAKKQKRDAQWQAEKAAAALEARKKARTTRKTIFKRAEAYVKEYRQKVRAQEGFCACQQGRLMGTTALQDSLFKPAAAGRSSWHARIRWERMGRPSCSH